MLAFEMCAEIEPSGLTPLQPKGHSVYDFQQSFKILICQTTGEFSTLDLYRVYVVYFLHIEALIWILENSVELCLQTNFRSVS